MPDNTMIGPGFRIIHGWGIVINAGATIGSNVTILQGATIGQGDIVAADGSRQTGYPTIGDNVWVGPHAIIVGNVTVGDGARILGGATVHFDVPPASLVGGNPGKIIRENVVEDVVNKVPPELLAQVTGRS